MPQRVQFQHLSLKKPVAKKTKEKTEGKTVQELDRQILETVKIF